MKFDYRINFSAKEFDILVVALAKLDMCMGDKKSPNGWGSKEVTELMSKISSIEKVQKMFELEDDNEFYIDDEDE